MSKRGQEKDLAGEGAVRDEEEGDRERARERTEWRTKGRGQHSRNSRVVRRMSGEQSLWAGEAQGEGVVRRVEKRMLAWTLKRITCTRDTGGAWRPACICYANRHHREPFIPSASDREWLLLGEGSLLREFLSSAAFCLNHQNLDCP